MSLFIILLALLQIHFTFYFHLLFNIFVFCSDYFNSTDLHIGVTTSTGVIVEFDRCGLRKSLDKGCKTLWAQSLLVESVPEAWIDHWDGVLAEV